MSASSLLIAMFCHVCLMALLYVLLTVLRAPAIWGLDFESGLIRKWAIIEPRISANLSNQFEWPMLFYAACILILMRGGVADNMQVVLAWVFVIGRLAHSVVQILTTNIRLRGAIFTINFLAVFLMWIKLVMSY